MSLKYTNLNHDFIQLNFGAIVNYGTGDVWLTLMLPQPGLNVLWLQVLSCFESGFTMIDDSFEQGHSTYRWYPFMISSMKGHKSWSGLGRLLFYFQNSFSVCVYRIRSIWVIFELWVCTCACVWAKWLCARTYHVLAFGSIMLLIRLKPEQSL